MPSQVDRALPGEVADEAADDAQADGDQGGARRVVDPRADPPEEGRQQRQRPEDHHQHADGRGDGHARDEVEPDEREAEQRDDHGDAGEEHGPAAGVDRLGDRVLDVEAELEPVPVAGDDEQGVVDADAEADHGDHRRGEVGHRDDVAGQRHERRGDAEAEQRGADRQAHRQHRTEGQDEDDDGGDDAEDLALGQLERRRTGHRRTRSRGPRPSACSSPKSLISVPSSVTSSKPRSVTSSWAKAMVPSALICWGLSYGLVTVDAVLLGRRSP